jgi:hypothetical protein
MLFSRTDQGHAWWAGSALLSLALLVHILRETRRRRVIGQPGRSGEHLLRGPRVPAFLRWPCIKWCLTFE